MPRFSERGIDGNPMPNRDLLLSFVGGGVDGLHCRANCNLAALRLQRCVNFWLRSAINRMLKLGELRIEHHYLSIPFFLEFVQAFWRALGGSSGQLSGGIGGAVAGHKNGDPMRRRSETGQSRSAA